MRPKWMFLLSVILQVQISQAQEWLLFKIYETGNLQSDLPFFDDYFYSEIAWAKTERNTSFYELNGKVKSVVEITETDTLDETPAEQAALYFDSKKRITHFIQGDSSLLGQWTCENYVYDQAGYLSERSRIGRSYGDYNCAFYRYDIYGFLVERIDSFSAYDNPYYYQANFTYGSDYSCVEVIFSPLGEMHWSAEDGNYEINYDAHGNYVMPGCIVTRDENNRPTSYFINNGCGSNSALCLSVSTTYDDRGNVIEQIVNDQTTRNSLWSFSSHFKAKYNDHNLLIERIQYPVDSYSQFLFTDNSQGGFSDAPAPIIYTFKYIFDEQENWIQRETFVNGVLHATTNRKIEYYE